MSAPHIILDNLPS